MTTRPICVEPYSLDEHLTNDESFASAYLRVIGAIARSAGSTSLSEYLVVNEIATSGDESAVGSITLLTALDEPRPLGDLLVQLKMVSNGVGTEIRRRSFDAARPLLHLQGYDSHDLAKKNC